MDSFQDAEEDFHGDFFGVLWVLHDACDEVVDALLEAFYEECECAFIALLDASDKRFYLVVVGHGDVRSGVWFCMFVFCWLFPVSIG